MKTKYLGLTVVPAFILTLLVLTAASVSAPVNAMEDYPSPVAKAEPATVAAPVGPAQDWIFEVRGFRAISELQALKNELKARLGDDAQVYEKRLSRASVTLAVRSTLTDNELKEQVVRIPLGVDRGFVMLGAGDLTLQGEIKDIK